MTARVLGPQSAQGGNLDTLITLRICLSIAGQRGGELKAEGKFPQRR
jgi:hypothetical protein